MHVTASWYPISLSSALPGVHGPLATKLTEIVGISRDPLVDLLSRNKIFNLPFHLRHGHDQSFKLLDVAEPIWPFRILASLQSHQLSFKKHIIFLLLPEQLIHLAYSGVLQALKRWLLFDYWTLKRLLF